MSDKSHISWTDATSGAVLQQHAPVDLVTERSTGGDEPLLIQWPLPGVWVGTSCEDQQRADERIPKLLATPAAVRFLSCEPLLGPVKIDQYLHDSDCWPVFSDLPAGLCICNDPREDHISWIIIGGESGPRFRPMWTEWALDLKRQCDAASVAVWCKQGSGRKSEQPFGHPELDGSRAFPAGVCR